MVYFLLAILPYTAIWITMQYREWRLERYDKPTTGVHFAIIAAVLQIGLAIPFALSLMLGHQVLATFVSGGQLNVFFSGDGLYLFALWTAISLLLAIPVGFVAYLVGTQLNQRMTPMDECPCDCGYDLTGNVSGVCPECGIPIKQRSSD